MGLRPPAPDQRQGVPAAVAPLGHQVQDHARRRPGDPPGAVDQDVSVAQPPGDEADDGGFVLRFQVREGRRRIVDRDPVVDEGRSLLRVAVRFLFEVVRNPGLDVGLLRGGAVQHVGDLPPVDELVVVLGIGLPAKIDGMPQAAAADSAAYVFPFLVIGSVPPIVDVEARNEAHDDAPRLFVRVWVLGHNRYGASGLRWISGFGFDRSMSRSLSLSQPSTFGSSPLPF